MHRVKFNHKTASKAVIKLFFKYHVNHKRYEACEKMCFYAILAVKIYRSCIKFRFHDSEGLFYFTSVMDYPGYFGRSSSRFVHMA